MRQTKVVQEVVVLMQYKLQELLEIPIKVRMVVMVAQIITQAVAVVQVQMVQIQQLATQVMVVLVLLQI